MICENVKCENKHDGSYGSGRFCSKACAHSRSFTEKQKQKISQAMGKRYKKYKCISCGDYYDGYKKTKKCTKCTRKVKHFNGNPKSILDMSKTTTVKLIRRAKISCVICGWDKSTCDIHHIKHKSKKGSNDNSNLIILCPNCHRIAHVNGYEEFGGVENLLKKSVEHTFKNWKKYYHISN